MTVLRRRLLLAAIAAPLAVPAALIVVGAFVVVLAVSGGSVSSAAVPPGGVTGGQLSTDAPVPDEVLAVLRPALVGNGCPALTESLLAAQLFQESGFNPQATSPVGAQGIAQFMPGTWPGVGRDENGNGVASPWEPEDAIPAAARYDCAIAKQVAAVPGDAAGLMLAAYNAGPGAVLQFNGIPPFQETQNYVRAILDRAATWAVSPGLVGVGVGPAPLPGGAQIELTNNPLIDTAVAWATGQIGSWYHFGGTCTEPFSEVIAKRCDCSSLMQQAYAHAGIALPRTAAMQSRVGAAVPPAEIQPGDLVVTVGADGTVARPGHIAMYVGSGYVVEAPFEGVQVHYFPVRGYHDIVTIRRIVTG
ncbi:MAG TPA: NlpC/P60 family protein [Mycobacteriales bacterium]|nr:NlpC/P60 family protein [Mycobacteriales bacterium]